jgi:predicted LPLAT superfamily acyltransferase
MHNRSIWMERPERGNLLGMKVLAWVALRLGRRCTRLFLWPICLYFLLFSPVACKAVRTFLMRATKHRPNIRDLFRHLFVYASTQLDRVYFLNGQIGLFDIRVYGERELSAVLAGGQGCFLMGSHLGSFEVLRVCGSQKSGIRISTLMHEESARKMNSVLRAINPAAPSEVIASGRIDSMLKVRDRLDRGDCIGILADRALTENAALRLLFLETPADFSVGPFRLAVMLGRPMGFMVGLYRGGNRYDIHFEQLSFDAESPSKAKSEQALLAYVRRLEYYCRLVPSNWFNFYDFWPPEDNC